LKKQKTESVNPDSYPDPIGPARLSSEYATVRTHREPHPAPSH